MNSKRQTVWLVSMLSLMVILSAYYLLTDNVKELDLTNDGWEVNLQADEQDRAQWVHEVLTEQEMVEQIRQQMTTSSSGLMAYHLERREAENRQKAVWYETITDPQASNPSVVEAWEKLREFEQKSYAIAQLEDELGREFANVFVLSDAERWKVLVQSEQLDRSQAVHIIDQVTAHLSVAVDKVEVQFLP